MKMLEGRGGGEGETGGRGGEGKGCKKGRSWGEKGKRKQDCEWGAQSSLSFFGGGEEDSRGKGGFS